MQHSDFKKFWSPARLATACISLAVATAAPAATLISFDFESDEGAFTLAPDYVAAGIVGTEWSLASGSLTDYTGVTGFALGGRGFDPENAFTLTIDLAPQTAIRLDALQFSDRASASGPTALRVTLGTQTLMTAATSTEFLTRSITDINATYTDRLTLQFAGLAAGSGSGTWRLDDVALEGTLSVSSVPIPASIWLFAAPAVCLGGARLRQRVARQTAR